MLLTDLKGLGEARLEALHKAGIFTLTDLLLTLPVRYQDTTTITPLGEAVPGGEICVCGFPKAAPRLPGKFLPVDPPRAQAEPL